MLEGPESASFAAALAAGPVLLDGGLATQLEAQGANLSTALWSAQLLLDDPDAIVAAHLAFFTAGAQVATTASYQAPLPLIPASVRLAQQARERVKSRGGTPRAPRGVQPGEIDSPRPSAPQPKESFGGRQDQPVRAQG